ncbi:MAG TPA: hypothetical protein VFR37_03225, partial [Longimicrobium sp.]|nr:hypothetical protein [Longimicrobium sp.]
MQDGTSSALAAPAPAPTERADWQRLARRLEALCEFAAETAGVVEADEVWRLLRVRLAGVLDADVAVLRTPLLAEPRAWAADGADDDLAGLLAQARDEGGEARRIGLPGGAAGVLVPLRHDGETLGTLLAGWRRGGGEDEDSLRVAERLGGHTAAVLANVRNYA